MKKSKLNVALLLVFSVMIGFFSSCNEDGCTIKDFEGTFVGKYKVIGAPFPNPDTVTISITSDNKLSMKSFLLRNTFEADFDESLVHGTVEDLSIERIDIGSQYFAGVFVDGGTIRLDASCGNIYIDLNVASVDSGTVDLSPIPGLTYENLKDVSISTAGNGLERQ